jgi:hypothetical protein
MRLVLAVVACRALIGCDAGPAPGPGSTTPAARAPSQQVSRWLATKIAAPPTELARGQPHLADSLSRCCATERATLGPLFGKLAIGPGYVETLPENLRPENTGLAIELIGGEGQFGMYLDGVRIEVPDHDACAQLQHRLEQMWGPGDQWTNPARHRAASFRWAVPESDLTACTVYILRDATRDPAHCLKDEGPQYVQEVDVKRHCLKPGHAIGCMLDRDRGGHPRQWCYVDDKHHTFWTSNEPLDDKRSCTREELGLVDFYKLRDC